MTRISLSDNSGRWFNLDTATGISEETYHDGRNWLSTATGKQFEHEHLYRTVGKVWILAKYSNYQGGICTYEIIDSEDVAEWLAKQGLDPHEDCITEYNALEVK